MAERARLMDRLLKLRLLDTLLGRRQLRRDIRHNACPLTRRLAALHRRGLFRHLHVVAVAGSFGKSTAVAAVRTVMGLQVSALYGPIWVGASSPTALRRPPMSAAATSH